MSALVRHIAVGRYARIGVAHHSAQASDQSRRSTLVVATPGHIDLFVWIVSYACAPYHQFRLARSAVLLTLLAHVVCEG